MLHDPYYMHGDSHCWHCGIIYADSQLKGVIHSECPRCGCLTARFNPLTDNLEELMGPPDELHKDPRHAN